MFPRLQIHIHHLTTLVHSPPQVMLLAVYFYEDFIDIECVAIPLMFALQSSRV
jgi:hypothetical protein